MTILKLYWRTKLSRSRPSDVKHYKLTHRQMQQQQNTLPRNIHVRKEGSRYNEGSEAIAAAKQITEGYVLGLTESDWLPDFHRTGSLIFTYVLTLVTPTGSKNQRSQPMQPCALGELNCLVREHTPHSRWMYCPANSRVDGKISYQCQWSSSSSNKCDRAWCVPWK